MIKITTTDVMRSINGGYRLKCTKCGAQSGRVNEIEASVFYLLHRHRRGIFAVWDYSYKNPTSRRA